MLERSSATAYLREATKTLHAALERDFDAVALLADPVSRTETIRRYGVFHAQAAILLAPFRGDALPEAMSESMPPASAPQGLPPPHPLPVLRSLPEALGFAYVIEGSRLGGKLILKALAQRGVDTSGMGFLNPGQDQAGARWRMLQDSLDRNLVDDPALQAAAYGARAGFDLARQYLCEVETP